MTYRVAHPLSDAVYAAHGDGLVEVEKDGKHGVFDAGGVWVSGEVRAADPQMCLWVATAGIASRHAAGFAELGADAIMATVEHDER